MYTYHVLKIISKRLDGDRKEMKTEEIDNIMRFDNTQMDILSMFFNERLTIYTVSKKLNAKSYKNVHKRVKRLERLKLIKKVKIPYGLHGSIYYDSTDRGVFCYQLLKDLKNKLIDFPS